MALADTACKKAQSGVGLIEVMVSLLLLAIGVLAYIGLQASAVKETSDSMARGNLLTIFRDIGDKIRYNPTAIATYKNSINSTATTQTSCQTGTCNPEAQAISDSYDVTSKASEEGFSLAMQICPGTAGKGVMQTYCLIGSWGTTSPTISSAAKTNDTKNCLDEGSGNYFRGAECLVMEIQ